MTELRVVTCDRCNPLGLLNGNDGRGYAYMSSADAIDRGWAREPGADIEGTDDTHYCIQCLDEEEAALPSSRLSSEEEPDARS